MLDEIDRLIRAGKSQSAREKLNDAVAGLKAKDAPRAANLAWRCHIPELGLKILGPIVRPAHAEARHATEEEKAEYAVCLIKLGATDEGLSLLDSTSVDKCGRSALYRAFAHITRWEYAKSNLLLESYLKNEPDPYARIVGEINLVQGLLFEKQFEASDEYLLKLKEATAREEFKLARGTVLELSAVRYLFASQYEKSQAHLTEASELLAQTAGLPLFFIEKWRTILEFLRGGGKNHAIIQNLREKARTVSHWETLRECDRVESVAKSDLSLFKQVYFGTPYESYRRKLSVDYPGSYDLPSFYPWTLGTEDRTHCEIDLSTGEIWCKKKKVALERLPLKLLVVLCTDFYRPFRIASLHHALHPGEYFNPVSSPARVHRAVQRLRQTFRDHKIGLGIAHTEGFYQLGSEDGKRKVIHVSKTPPLLEGVSPELFKLQRMFAHQTFSLKEAAETLGLPSRTVSRIVERAEYSGEVLRTGSGRSTRYHFLTKTSR